MNSNFIEHINLTVRDPDRMAKLLTQIFGWHIRWQGPAMDNGYTVHVGTDTCYIALYTKLGRDYAVNEFDKGQPLNHVAIIVDDLTAVESKVAAAGLIPFGHDDYDPGRRFYFYDYDGIEFEVVSYALARTGG
ncbi:VOC family protein [Sphingorhabdus arenilitoris]|uniref:VOC family protein n=1 Tax=Sphingorhabdus arenilitoris TaxID=1490041 RepID=A0ABV8RID7_9SPHN